MYKFQILQASTCHNINCWQALVNQAATPLNAPKVPAVSENHTSHRIISHKLVMLDQGYNKTLTWIFSRGVWEFIGCQIGDEDVI